MKRAKKRWKILGKLKNLFFEIKIIKSKFLSGNRQDGDSRHGAKPDRLHVQETLQHEREIGPTRSTGPSTGRPK